MTSSKNVRVKNKIQAKIRNIFAYVLLFITEVFELYILFKLAFVLRTIFLEFFGNVFNVQAVISWQNFLHDNFWIPLVYVFVFCVLGLWQRNQTFWYEWEQLVKGSIVATFTSYAIISILHTQDVSSRLIVGIFGLLVLSIVPIVRYVLKQILVYFGVYKFRYIFVGDTNYFKKVQEILGVNKYLGMQVVKHYEYPNLDQVKDIKQFAEKIKQEIHKNGYNGVILQTSGLGDEKIDILAEFLLANNIDVMMFPLSLNYRIAHAQIYYLMYENYFFVRLPKGLYSPYAQFVKRIIDIIGGILALIVFSPILLITALLIWFFDGTPVVYVAKRYGKHGKLFDFIKFRYMLKSTSFNPEYEQQFLQEYFKKHPDLKEMWEKYKKLPIDKDPRIIPKIGKILAKFDLPELPQIFNVIKGDMSLVGPRPYLPREKDDIGDYFDRIHVVKPGITGLWQVMGGNKRTFNERLEIDTWYPKNWSIWLDIVIILKTIQLIIKAIVKKLLKLDKKDKKSNKQDVGVF